MQPALTSDVLVPLGAGAVVVVVALVLVLLSVRRKRTDDTPEPRAVDWTGEAATGDAQFPLRPTVARLLADRAAVTPVQATGSTASVPDSHGEPRPAPRETTRIQPSRDDLSQSEQAETPPTGVPQGERAAEDDLHVVTPEPDPEPDPEPAEPTPDRVGSGTAVAAAVAHALAMRAAGASGAAGQPAADGPGPTATAPAIRPEKPPPDPPAAPGDARDRLLAVLLDDPEQALVATTDLDACRGRLQGLDAALRHERGVLADVLARLAATGLDHEQLSRLADLPVDEVRHLLAQQGAPVR